MELESVRTKLEQEGYALLAISYDPVDVLASFADRYAIDYPLLSDEGSSTIRRLGLLNDYVKEHHAVYGIPLKPHHEGLPYPGVFVVDEQGVVTDKRFYQSYRERETGAGILERALGIAAPRQGPAVDVSTRGVNVRVFADSASFGYFQRIWLSVVFDIDDGLHMYGDPIPPGYLAAHVSIDPVPGIDVGDVEWPEPEEFYMGSLDETFQVYTGAVRAFAPLTFSGEPGGGDVEITGNIAFQVCSSAECHVPTQVAFRLPLEERALVERPIKR